jgi:hypothetical protein
MLAQVLKDRQLLQRQTPGAARGHQQVSQLLQDKKTSLATIHENNGEAGRMKLTCIFRWALPTCHIYDVHAAGQAH